MKTTTQVAIIGGGVVGCSVLYHLTKLGWSDVMLIERSELTSGSTWHAAGGFHTLNGDTNMAALQSYTIKLYKELEEITGMACGLHHVGGLTLAENQDRFDMLIAERAKHRYMGLHTEIFGPEQIKEFAPITNTDGIVGALYDPLDGHLDPSGTTHAYAKAARMGGATIETHTMVSETNQRPDGTWDVVTDKGTIHAEHVVNAGGLWAREVGAMAGVYLPLHPMEHQYLITEDIPQFVDADEEAPHVIDPSGESYLRQERNGICIGFYEKSCRPWAVDGTPWSFGTELLENDFDKIEDSIAFAYKRFPILESAGIKNVIHGPFTFAPDGNPLVGPVPGLRNYWSACGVMAGFSQGGGVGLTLAQWMIDGEPAQNATAMDVGRFGPWITPGYTRPKVIENYQKRFSVPYPNEELPAARPHRTTPMYDIFTGLGAVWGHQFGLEVPNYFAKPGEPTFDRPSFRRSDAFSVAAREVKAVRSSLGINEVQNFGKFRVTGDNARAWLDRIMAGRIPKPGRISLTPMLTPKGKLQGDFTVSCLSETEFALTASYGYQTIHQRWFEQYAEPSVTVENISDRQTGFQIAGPNAKALLAACTRDDAAGMKFLDVARMTVGQTACIVGRISYTGDLGYEIYCDAMDQRQLWSTLWDAGQQYDITPFGMHAMMSLRLDRLFGAWLREFSPDYTASETSMDRFIQWSKNTDFIGRAAAEAERTTPPDRILVAFEVDVDDADVTAYEPIFMGEDVVGFCTSGGYSHHLGKSIAQGFVPRARLTPGMAVEIELMGKRRAARHITSTGWDDDQSYLRS